MQNILSSRISNLKCLASRGIYEFANVNLFKRTFIRKKDTPFARIENSTYMRDYTEHLHSIRTAFECMSEWLTAVRAYINNNDTVSEFVQRQLQNYTKYRNINECANSEFLSRN